MIQQTLIKDSTTGKDIELLDFLYDTQIDKLLKIEYSMGNKINTEEYLVVDIHCDVIKSWSSPKRIFRVISVLKIR